MIRTGRTTAHIGLTVHYKSKPSIPHIMTHRMEGVEALKSWIIFPAIVSFGGCIYITFLAVASAGSEMRGLKRKQLNPYPRFRYRVKLPKVL